MNHQNRLFDELNPNFKDYFRQVISYEPELQKIADVVKNLSYNELIEFRSEFIRTYESISIEPKTEEAKAKYWERLINNLEIQFNFKRPQSTSRAAQTKRRYRASKGY